METAETVKGNHSSAIMASLLLALLLISQLSLASESSNYRNLLDSDNYGSLEKNVDYDLDSNVNDYSPDLIINSFDEKQSTVIISSTNDVVPVFIKSPFYSYSIRSPPCFS